MPSSYPTMTPAEFKMLDELIVALKDIQDASMRGVRDAVWVLTDLEEERRNLTYLIEKISNRPFNGV